MIVSGVELNVQKRDNLAVKKLLISIGVSKKEDLMVEIVIGDSINASQLIHVQKHMESTFAEIINNWKGKIYI